MTALRPPDPPLSDGVVVLRPWTDGDVAAITAACQDPQISRWTQVPSPYTPEDARLFIGLAARLWAAGTAAPLAITAAADGTVVGATGLNAIDAGTASADLGYWVAAHARGRGVATRAVELVAEWAFGALALERLELRPHRDNAGSQAVARRAGFRPAERPLTRGTSGHGPGMLVFARRRPA